MKLFNLLALSALAITVATAPAFAEHHEGKEGGAHPLKGKMFEKVDSDGDGIITKAESDAFHDKKFSEMDADSDGKVTKGEAEAMKEKMKAKWEEMKAKRGAGNSGAVAE